MFHGRGIIGQRQIILAGTPPYPGCPGTVFRRRRTVSLENPSPSDAWHEWSLEGESLEGRDLTDRALWYETNPSLGVHLTEDFTAEECASLSPDGFARERLGWWSPVLTQQDDRAVDAAAWAACRSEAPKPEGKTAYGVKFAPDGSEVVLCGAVCPAEGPARISLIERRPMGQGVRWLADWLCQRYDRAACVVIDGRNGPEVLIDRIKDTWRHKQSVVRPGVRDVLAAASLLTTELTERTVTWYALQAPLEDSALTSVKRPLSGGWAFGGPDPYPIEAAALALWGCRTSKRDPGQKMRIG